jgi:hypothetical protein
VDLGPAFDLAGPVALLAVQASQPVAPPPQMGEVVARVAVVRTNGVGQGGQLARLIRPQRHGHAAGRRYVGFDAAGPGSCSSAR